MASRVCWLCEQASHQTPRSDPHLSNRLGQYCMLFQCDECGAGSIGANASGNAAQAKMGLPMSQSLDWWPKRYEGKHYADVPDHIASAASEAHTCFSAQAYRAAILLARAVVEATAKDKGITSGTLASKIEGLHSAGHVRELVRDTADEIRFMGNDMAHGDFVEAVTETEAEDILTFMAEVLEEVYQAPARLNARRAERLARKAQETSQAP